MSVLEKLYLATLKSEEILDIMMSCAGELSRRDESKSCKASCTCGKTSRTSCDNITKTSEKEAKRAWDEQELEKRIAEIEKIEEEIEKSISESTTFTNFTKDKQSEAKEELNPEAESYLKAKEETIEDCVKYKKKRTKRV